MATRNQQAAVFAMASYWYNTSAVERAKQLFPGRHPDYLAEWVERMTGNFGRAVEKMEGNTFTRFVDLALTPERLEYACKWLDANGTDGGGREG